LGIISVFMAIGLFLRKRCKWIFIACLPVFIITSMLVFLNQHYTTPIIDVGSNEKISIPYSESAQNQTMINLDGTKSYTVDLGWLTNMDFKLGGSYFNSLMYTIFKISAWIEMLSHNFLDLLNQLGDNSMNIVLTFIVVLLFKKLNDSRKP
jgi:hypothetical protein